MVNDLWKQYALSDEDPPLHLALGGLQVWIRRNNEEIWIAHQNKEEASPESATDADVPADLGWARWAHKSADQQITVSPVFPDLPIVISPEYPMTISPGAKIQIFTRIPIWMRISLGKTNYVLKEIPSVLLSRTWFGTPIEGELSYWLTTKARRSLEEVESKPFVVNCPIWITNKDETDLHFEKFCFRVERLGIYRCDDNLWAGETQIVYHGEDSNSDITMPGKLPATLGKGEQLSKPRNPVQTSLATRTFKKLFDDTFISR